MSSEYLIHLQNTLYCRAETHPQSWSKQPPWAEYSHYFLVNSSNGLPYFRPAWGTSLLCSRNEKKKKQRWQSCQFNILLIVVKPSGRRCGKPCYGPNIPTTFLPTNTAPPPRIPQVSLPGYSPRTFLCELNLVNWQLGS